jgi:hypothetical protein
MSSSAVASSSTSTPGAAMNARANEISCRWPADGVVARHGSPRNATSDRGMNVVGDKRPERRS